MSEEQLKAFIEQLKAFMEAVKADAGLQEKLNAAADAYAVVGIAMEAGFVITAEELQRAQVEVMVDRRSQKRSGTGWRAELGRWDLEGRDLRKGSREEELGS